MEFFIKYFRYHCHVISCIINYYIISVENGLIILMTNVTSKTLEYYLSNDTTLVPFEPVSKNYMLAYLNVNCLNALLTLQCNEHCGEILYINDINGNIKSSIRLFADDSIIYRKISSKTDHEILQTDLSQLQTWSDKWQMEFNVSKCVHLPITNKTKPSTHKY